MPKVPQRANTPPTPRVDGELLRKSSLYRDNPLTPHFKKEQYISEDEGLVRQSTKGIRLASEVPSSQQVAERNSGFVRRQKVSQVPERGWYVGTSNKVTTYSTEPKNLLRFGHRGAKNMQRGRLNVQIMDQEWTPKLVSQPVAHNGPISMCSPALWPDDSQYVTGSSVLRKRQLAKEQKHPAWYERSGEVSVPLLFCLKTCHSFRSVCTSSLLLNNLSSIHHFVRFARETTVCPPVLSRKPDLSSSQNEERSKPWSEENMGTSKDQSVSERLLRTLDRERAAEAKFAVETAAVAKRQSRRRQQAAADGGRAAGTILTEGLGPEARLRVLRRNKRRESGQGGWGGEARIVIPAHERRKPRTCGGLLAVVENRADVDVAEAMRKEASAEQRRAAQKWQLLGRFHAKWYQHDRQKGPQFSYAPLVTMLAEASDENADNHTLTRDQFMSCTLLRLRDVNLAHRLYSALDADNTDKLPWIDIVAPLVMLAAGQMGKGQREVLLAGLQLFEVVTPPLTMASTLKVLTMAAGSRLERLEVESRASMGFEFSLRAAAAAADLTDDLLPPATTPGGRKRVPSNLNPERVLQVLQEYPELADDVNRQVLSSF